MTVEIIHGKCELVLPTLEAESFHACVTDPPYHLTSIVKRFGSETAAPAKSNGATGVYARSSSGFMGKTWDGGDIAFRPETWAAVYRVLKPGAHLLAFGGTRTFHRLACAIEDAGFEIRDTIMWLYGSGFPKSLDVSKAIDRAGGAERAVVGSKLGRPGYALTETPGTSFGVINDDGWIPSPEKECAITAPSTEAARAWQGWGTALKPACELVCIARKPLSEGTVAANVLRHGTGALNIDASRVTGEVPQTIQGASSHIYGGGNGLFANGLQESSPHPNGRWPANVCHDGSPEVMDAFPDADGGGNFRLRSSPKMNGIYGTFTGGDDRWAGYGDTGTAARFFFCGKADASERVGNHPTVKPVALMEWLVGLVTPPGGRVLDPFCGTGSTLVACDRLSFDAVGIEQDAQTVADAHEKIRRLRARRAIGDAERMTVSPDQMVLPL